MTQNRIRIYPLRLTTRKWRIPIHIRHQCSEQCSKTLVQHPDNKYNFVIQDNPDYQNGRCPSHNKLDSGMMKIAFFSQNNPQGVCGPLHNPDEIVIPDQKISIEVDYPLTNTITATIDFDHPNITRSELLYAISSMYKHIYDVEERTSPSLQYTVVRDCEKCTGKTAYDYVISIRPTEKKEECSICYQNYKRKKAVKLPCDHIFHDECIKKWIDDKNTCPLCRDCIMECGNCNGKRRIYEEHESVVIPIEHRGNILNRNPTFGVFGIYGHDLEDLCLHEMEYDRTTRKLYLFMSS